MKKPYNNIISHYEECLEKHGDTHLGVDWPKIEDVDKRYKVMLDIIKFDELNLTTSKFNFLYLIRFWMWNCSFIRIYS